MLHRLQRGEGRGIVAARLREYLLPRGPEDQGPAQRVAVEQPSTEPARPLATRAPAACHALRRGDGDVLEDGGMDQLVHDAQTERLLRAFDLAREDDVERRAGANPAGEARAAARPQETAAPGAVSGAPAPWPEPSHRARKSRAGRPARPGGPSRGRGSWRAGCRWRRADGRWRWRRPSR